MERKRRAGSGNMDFGKTFFSPKGRISRKTFWFASISLFVWYVVANMMIESTDETIVGLGSLFMVGLIWPTVAVQVKRWHDRDKSGWWYLISYVPIIGPPWVLIELGFLKGTDGANRYGFPPGTGRAYKYESDTGGSEDSYIPYPLADLIAMFAKIAKSDGVVSRAEVDLIDDFFITILRLTPEMRKEAIRIFNKAKASTVPYEVYAKRFYQFHEEHPELLEVVVDFLFALGLADGELSAEEEILISQTQAIFGMEHERYNTHREERRRAEEERSRERPEKYYAEILGLSGSVTAGEVKRVYRNLAMQYHPDKVAHLGPKLRQVAHEEMKKINEAYAFFREKYALEGL
jgi:DnaJ like chaperone protein